MRHNRVGVLLPQFKTTVFLCSLVLLSSAEVRADSRFSVVGAGNFSDRHDTGATLTDSTSAKLAYGGGVLIEFPLSTHWSFELGGLYLQRAQSDTTLLPAVDATATIAEVPLLLRYYFGQHFALGAGGYYASAIGNVNFSDGTSGTYQALGLNSSDYGVVGSVSLYALLGSSVAFLVDGRCTYGLSNASTITGITSNYIDFQALAGLRFGGNK